MTTYIHHIETLLPDFSYLQDYARDRMIGWMPGKRNRRLIQGIYDHSGIDTRYSVLPDFGPDAQPLLFRENRQGLIEEPTTQERNRVYRECSRRMLVELGRKTLAATPHVEAGDITHVVTVSCTGFYNPGPDLDLIQGLGLKPDTERYNIGFMGCYAAFPALRMADQFCRANPDATVLVVCLELCSLHLQFREEPDSLLANALFADGAAAAVLSAQSPADDRAAFAIRTFSSALAEEGSGDMAWEIGDRGFDIRLSSYIPNIISANIAKITEDIFRRNDCDRDFIRNWAIHPGGRAILDRIEESLELDADALTDSREVLRRFGNMSSATILFVLKRMLHRRTALAVEPTCAMAFGPGLTIETALLDYQPAACDSRKVRHVVAEA